MPAKKTNASVPKKTKVPKPGAGSATPKPQASWNNNFLNGGFTFGRRAWYGSTPQDSKKDVRESDRLQLIQRARYAEKNYPSMVQYVNDMVMYVVGDGLTPTSHAADPAKARLYEQYYFVCNLECCFLHNYLQYKYCYERISPKFPNLHN